VSQLFASGRYQCVCWLALLVMAAVSLFNTGPQYLSSSCFVLLLIAVVATQCCQSLLLLVDLLIGRPAGCPSLLVAVYFSHLSQPVASPLFVDVTQSCCPLFSCRLLLPPHASCPSLSHSAVCRQFLVTGCC